MSTNWTAELDNPANKRFVTSFMAKYKREPATFAALSYDAIKLIDFAVRDVNGKIENKDAVRAALRKANFQLVRGSFKFNNNHYPIQDLYIMEVMKDEKGMLKAVLKDTAVKDWQDPYHQECPMKWCHTRACRSPRRQGPITTALEYGSPRAQAPALGQRLGLQNRAPRDSPTVSGDRWMGHRCAYPQGAP